jgi:hypothetical protein
VCVWVGRESASIAATMLAGAQSIRIAPSERGQGLILGEAQSPKIAAPLLLPHGRREEALKQASMSEATGLIKNLLPTELVDLECI